MEQAVSRRKKIKIIIAPTYDNSRAKIALWNDPQVNSNTIRKSGRKEMFYLTTHSTHFIYGYMALDIW